MTAVRTIVEQVAPAEQEPTCIVPVRLSLEDICNPPRERYVLGSMVPFAKSSVLFGPTSIGKSALAAQVAFAFAAGAESLWGLPLYRDEETEECGGPVLVYTAEDTLDDWKRKGGAVRCGGGIDMERALSRLHIIDQSEGIARLSEVVTVRSGGPGESVSRRIARPTEEQDRVIAEAIKVGAKLVLVETASRLVEDEDNANFSALQSALGRIGRETGAAVLVSHHATKAASRENDNAIESARGGGSLIANARNALALFPAEPETIKAYTDRFPAEDIVTLAHGKATSSTRRSAPITLVRCDAKYGAVFRLPDEVARTPEEDQANNRRMELERQREQERLGRLYDVVADLLRLGPVSQTRLRDRVTEIGIEKRKLESLILLAVKRGVLKTAPWAHGRGKALDLGQDPRL
jgi:RecA-family ATPase